MRCLTYIHTSTTEGSKVYGAALNTKSSDFSLKRCLWEMTALDKVSTIIISLSINYWGSLEEV